MKRFLILFFLLSAICLLMLSCASNWTKTHGSYEQEPEITTMFETHEYVSDYNYFYTDYANHPVAIVGIKKDYELVKVSGWGITITWQKFEAGGDKLKELVGAVRNPGPPPYGYIINAPAGNQVGVMYIKKWGPQYFPEILFLDGNQLEITPYKYNSTFAPP